jgi:hypothetical protein
MARNKDNSISFPVRIDYEQKVEPGSDVFTSKTGTQSFVRTRTGQNCPNYREKIENGENATTSMVGVYDAGYHSRSDGQVVSVYKFAPPQQITKTFTKSDMCFLANNLAFSRGPREPAMDITATISAAAAQFYAKLRSQQVVMTGLTTLGEARELLHMLRRPGEAFYKGSQSVLDAYYRAKRRSPKDWMKTASGLWLEGSFGWQPAINDALAAVKALRSLGKERSAKVSAGATRSEDRTSSLPPQDNATDYAEVMGTKWSSKSTLYEAASVRYRAGLRAQAELPQWQGNLATFGFKPEEFVPTLWELLPWSFLADYFTNIGDMIEANATDTSRVAWISRSIVRTSKYRGSVSCNIAESGATPKANYVTGGSVSPSSWYFTRKRVTRSGDVSLPIVTFQLDTGPSLGQKLNILALLGQANELHRQDYRWRIHNPARGF